VVVGVPVGVAVGVAVGVGGADRLSTAPMSQPAPCGRAMPR
jgi:hypothetical protein